MAVALAACGPSPEPRSGAQGGDAIVGGCEPMAVAARLGDFLKAVAARRRAAALRHLAPGEEFLRATLYRGSGPGAPRIDASAPEELYDALVAAVGPGEGTAPVLVAVGGAAPFAHEYEERAGAAPTAGVEFAARIGAGESLSGKVGVECRGGGIYLGAMHTARGLRPQVQCGQRVRLDAQRPLLCRI